MAIFYSLLIQWTYDCLLLYSLTARGKMLPRISFSSLSPAVQLFTSLCCEHGPNMHSKDTWLSLYCKFCQFHIQNKQELLQPPGARNFRMFKPLLQFWHDLATYIMKINTNLITTYHSLQWYCLPAYTTWNTTEIVLITSRQPLTTW